MNSLYARSRSFMLAALLTAATSAFAAMPSESVQIEGTVNSSLTLKVEDLKAFPADQISSVVLKRRVDKQEISSTVRGVKLSALIERAQLLIKNEHNDWKHMVVVVASADDGYRVAFSWPELVNTEIGAGVLVIFERDGQALDDGEGRIALVSARDLRSGPRHIRWLSRIEVKLL